MLVLRSITLGALLLSAAPLFSQDPRLTQSFLLDFTLEESQEQVAKKMGGAPHQVAEAGPRYLSWQYRLGDDLHDPSHLFVFREDRKLISLTRSFEHEELVDALFPAKSTTTHHWSGTDGARFSVRLRRLGPDRLLLAMGSPKPGVRTGQLLLIRQSALRFFLPWLDEQLRER